MSPTHAATAELDPPYRALGTSAARDDLVDHGRDVLRAHLGLYDGDVTARASGLDEAWRLALDTLLAPGDTVLALRNGPASDRWCARAADAGLTVEAIDAPWGEPAAYDDLAQTLARDVDGRIKAVFVVHHDAALGVASNLVAVRDALDVADHLALLLADVSGSIGSAPLHLEMWGVDAAVAGELAGAERELALVAWGGRAHRGRGGSSPCTQLDRAHLETFVGHVAAGAAEAARRRHAEAVRFAVAAWGMEILARDAVAAPATTACRVPAGIDTDRAARLAPSGVTTVGDRLAGSALTLRHGSLADDAALLDFLEGVEAALLHAGARFAPGAGVGRAKARLEATRSLVDLAA